MPTPKSKTEKVILVDPSDRKIGEMEKILAHKFGMLHRAFSVFIFRKQKGKLELLLQQRNQNKYHAGGLWTNTCCSHPRINETNKEAAENRLKYEMGIEAKLKRVGKFHYIAQFKNGMTENEIDHVWIGMYEGNNIPYNPEEVENYKWVDIGTLEKDLRQFPERYTPWFKQALELALSEVQKDEVGYEKSRSR